MTTKLIDMNIGIQLTLLVDGKQKLVTWSAVYPTHLFNQPLDAVMELCEFLNDTFCTEYVCYDSASEPKEVKVAKPKRIKAHRTISQDEYNKRIKELQP